MVYCLSEHARAATSGLYLAMTLASFPVSVSRIIAEMFFYS